MASPGLSGQNEARTNMADGCAANLNKSWTNLVPRAIMSFSCRTQPPVLTLVPTYTFVGNLFQAFVMYARVGLRGSTLSCGSRRFGLVLTGTSLCLARNRPRSMFADMQNSFTFLLRLQHSKCKHSTEMKPNMQARTFEDSVNGKISNRPPESTCRKRVHSYDFIVVMCK